MVFKKILVFILVFIVFLGMIILLSKIDMTGLTVIYEEESFENKEYLISNCFELQDINKDLNGNYSLVNDIDCSEFYGFELIGSAENPFRGKFDSKDYIIMDLYSENSSELKSLFDSSEGEIINLKIEYEEDLENDFNDDEFQEYSSGYGNTAKVVANVVVD